ncbi:hypothetical protein [Pararhodonellum marinum]|uniref:hypothetical protein n=1 Tax=Pararhodonellum marinum TaxID=2755358 RepID=UPI00188FA2B5|nr:hypothetical protein [Pararhodonellum marinum]
MKRQIDFLKNSWTLRIVLIITAFYIGISLISGEKVSISEIIITFSFSCISFGVLEKSQVKGIKKRTTTAHNKNGEICGETSVLCFLET